MRGNGMARKPYIAGRNFKPCMQGFIVLLGLLSAVPYIGAGAEQKSEAKRDGKAKVAKPERPPAIEQITEHTFRVGAALVDTRERIVTCPGEINMDEGAIEYLAVAPGGKTHESLLRIDVRPLHFQLALLMLDLEPKNVLTQQGDRNTPKGDPVELRIRWRDRGGEMQSVRAEELVLEGANAKPMAAHDWVFTGSRILKQGFQADLEKSLVAVWHDPAAILDNPLPGGGNNAYIVNARRTPRRGTKIDLIVRAAVAPAKPRPPSPQNCGEGGRGAGGKP